ncbi:hypothetical protein [Streptomyces sp. NRRL F-5053]|uniref:hypothetical protein n=1 Tax=Streptomyces sp. NRRL F-5053 TaxID=1463854 RepID=UPI00055A7B5C|nr:hypothetical protein [Streptomyces sp. NRRL F-5053]
MSDTQTDTPSDEQTAGEGTQGGRHRGRAAVAEEQVTVPGHGRHRRPGPESGHAVGDASSHAA